MFGFRLFLYKTYVWWCAVGIIKTKNKVLIFKNHYNKEKGGKLTKNITKLFQIYHNQN